MKFEMLVGMFHGFNYAPLLKAQSTERLKGMLSAMEHILQLENGKKRYLGHVSALKKAFALASPCEKAMKIQDELLFFQDVRAGLTKATGECTGEGKTPEGIDTAIRQLVSRAIAPSDKVIDIFGLFGRKTPNIVIFSEDFLSRRLLRESPPTPTTPPCN